MLDLVDQSKASNVIHLDKKHFKEIKCPGTYSLDPADRSKLSNIIESIKIDSKRY